MTAFIDVFTDLFRSKERPDLECQPLVASALPTDVASSASRFIPNGLSDTRSRRICPPSIRFGLATAVGFRDDNQDVALAVSTREDTPDSYPSAGVFMVADGVGGRLGGAEASRTATEVIGGMAIEEIIVPLLEMYPDRLDDVDVWDTLQRALTIAHETVQRELPGSGSTTTVAVVQDNQAYIAHVGDSRAYLIADGSIRQLTRDHSFAYRLYELGSISAAEIAGNTYRNMLYWAIGSNDDFGSDSIPSELPPGSQLMLCTDGLWNSVHAETLLRIVGENSDPQKACDQLVALALDHGARDNVTVLLATMS